MRRKSFRRWPGIRTWILMPRQKKRQEIQKRISDLNAQLRRHQAEERRKAQQEKQQNVRQEERPGKSGEVGNVIDERL